MSGRILINARFSNRKVTGVERYAGAIASRLSREVVLLKPPRAARGMLGHLWEQLLLPRQIGASDVLWSPANTGPLLANRHILTIHDLAWMDHPEWFRPSIRIWYTFLLPRLIHRSCVIITDSTFTKIRILERFRISENRVKVIPGGVDQAHFHPANLEVIGRVRVKYQLPERYFLYVGSLAPHKNLGVLLQAWKLLPPEVRCNLGLVIAGAHGTIFRSFELDSPGRGVHLLGYVADRDLPALYSGAQALIQPSLYEGFGLTVLEAMACGIPAVAANAGALREAAGDAALYFEPCQPASLVGVLTRLLGDEPLRRDVIRAGHHRAQAFNWDRAAARVSALLQSAAG